MRTIQNIRRRVMSWRMSKLSIDERFALIYRSGGWFRNLETRSGAGSTLEATQTLRQELPHILAKLECKKLLDIGCGDFNWMKETKLQCQYLGVDIVRDLIRENTLRYETESIKFSYLDATKDKIPSGYDVIFCREVLFHLSNQDVSKVLTNISESNARFLIVTNMSLSKSNTDIISGGYRPLDLRKEPFSLCEPIYEIKDNVVSSTRTLGVWEIKDLTRDSMQVER